MYTEEYYFIRSPRKRADLPFLTPDESTSNRNYEFEAIPMGQPPLKFYNGLRNVPGAKNTKAVVTDILFSGFNLIVSDRIRERLLNFDLPNLHIFPAIYIDDENQWHEDRWFLTFTQDFDCWDRNTSEYDRDEDPIRLGGQEYYMVFQFAFNEKLLDSTPLEKRLLFRMGGVTNSFITVHQSVLTKIFGDQNLNGAEYVKVSDFGR